MSIEMLLVGIFGRGACLLGNLHRAAAPAQSGHHRHCAHVAFRVSDLDREIVFLGKLGYEEAFTLTYGKPPKPSSRSTTTSSSSSIPQTDPSQPLGWMHICYEAGDLNALQQYYATQGLNPTPVRKGRRRKPYLFHQRSRAWRHRIHAVHARLSPHPRPRAASWRGPHLH